MSCKALDCVMQLAPSPSATFALYSDRLLNDPLHLCRKPSRKRSWIRCWPMPGKTTPSLKRPRLHPPHRQTLLRECRYRRGLKQRHAYFWPLPHTYTHTLNGENNTLSFFCRKMGCNHAERTLNTTQTIPHAKQQHSPKKKYKKCRVLNANDKNKVFCTCYPWVCPSLTAVLVLYDLFSWSRQRQVSME